MELIALIHWACLSGKKGASLAMIPVEPPQLPTRCGYNPMMGVGLISAVALVFAFFLAMFFLGIGKDSQAHHAPTIERQMPAGAPEYAAVPRDDQT
jgi:hypothetical protein